MFDNHPQDQIDQRATEIAEDTGLDLETARTIAAKELVAEEERRRAQPPRRITTQDWYRTPPPATPPHSASSLPDGSPATPFGCAPQPSAASCPACHGAGWLSGGAGQAMQPCRCLLTMRQARAQEQAAAQRTALLERLQGELGRLRACTFERFAVQRDFMPLRWEGQYYTAEAQAQALRYAVGVSQTYADLLDGWLYLCGPVGAGKSHLAAAVALAAAARGTPTSYVSMPQALRWLRQGFGADRAEGTDSRLEALMQVELLVLDDLGAEHTTGWALGILFDLVNTRYNQNRPTVLTSNVRLASVPDRIASRIAGQATTDSAEIVLPLSDYRSQR